MTTQTFGDMEPTFSADPLPQAGTKLLGLRLHVCRDGLRPGQRGLTGTAQAKPVQRGLTGTAQSRPGQAREDS